MSDDIALTEAELRRITGYKLPCKQLAVLHKRGFHRAYIAHEGGVVLERAHHDAVCRGQSEKPRKSANIGFLQPKPV
jgi:hypothetical protein